MEPCAALFKRELQILHEVTPCFAPALGFAHNSHNSRYECRHKHDDDANRVGGQYGVKDALHKHPSFYDHNDCADGGRQRREHSFVLFEKTDDFTDQIHDLFHRRHQISLDFDPQCADTLLDVAKAVADLLDLSFRCGREGFVHAADTLSDDLRECFDPFGFGAVFENLFLGFGEFIAVTAQCADLSVHNLTHHAADGHCLFLRGVEAVLLCQHIVHHR